MDFKSEYQALMNSEDTEHWGNGDWLDEIGDLANKYNMSSTDLKSVMKEVGADTYLQIIIDETIEIENTVPTIKNKWNSKFGGLLPSTMDKYRHSDYVIYNQEDGPDVKAQCLRTDADLTDVHYLRGGKGKINDYLRPDFREIVAITT